MERARLAGIEGIGELKVVRDADGRAVEIKGLWRPHDDHSEDLGRMQALRDSGEQVQYEGPISDPSYPETRSVSLSVEVWGLEDYTYDHGDGKTRQLVKIASQGPLDYEGGAKPVTEVEAPVIRKD